MSDGTEDREGILKRRQKLIATALAGASITVASACAQPCLRYAVDSGPRDSGTDTGVEDDAGEEPDAGAQSDGG